MKDLRKVNLNDIPPEIPLLQAENISIRTGNTKLEKQNKILKNVLLGLTIFGGALSIFISGYINKNYIRVVKKKEK
jgi:hypothetical protein